MPLLAALLALVLPDLQQKLFQHVMANKTENLGKLQ